MLNAAEAAGAVFSPWHPVSIGEGPEGEAVTQAIEQIAQRHTATSTQIALAWQLHRSPATLPIPGTTSRAHLAENLGAPAISLSADEVETITALVPES